jgi:hypothetical protein
MTKKFLLIASVLTSIWILVEIFMGFFGTWIIFLFDIALIWFIVTIFAQIVGNRSPFFPRLIRNTLLCGSILGFLSLLVVGFAFFSNTFPASLSSITLSSGKSEIVFVQMSHIGTREYYDDIQARLKRLSDSWYSFYREWVLPGSDENMRKFDQALGIKISWDTYKNIASYIWMESQDDAIYGDISVDRIYPVDLSIDDLMITIGTGMSLSWSSTLDPMMEFVKLKDSRSWPLFPYIIRGFLNLSLRTLSSPDILWKILDPHIASAILDARNKHLVETFLKGNDKKIAIVYGALHFEWVYALLRSYDTNWQIHSIENYYPYKK